MYNSLSFINDIRIQEKNDWVILVLLFCTFLLIFMMNVVQRNARIKDFFSQEYFDSPNNFATWIIVSIVHCLCFSTLVSQYIPIVPEWARNIQLFGYELNKMGFCTIVITLFYFTKSTLSFILYQCIGDAKKWPLLYFVTTKFYFLFTITLMVGNIILYYFPINRGEAFPYYLLGLGAIFIFKLLFYLLYTGNIMPQKWYYKFLYICTLQIIPLFGMWKLLFF